MSTKGGAKGRHELLIQHNPQQRGSTTLQTYAVLTETVVGLPVRGVVAVQGRDPLTRRARLAAAKHRA